MSIFNKAVLLGIGLAAPSIGLAAPSSQQMSFVATMWKFYEDVQRQRRAGSGADIEFDTAAIPGECAMRLPRSSLAFMHAPSTG